MRSPGATPSPSTTPTSAVEQGTEAASDIVTIDTPRTAVSEAGATPMAHRVPVPGLLNTRNGDSRDITLKPGQAVRVGGVIGRVRACEDPAPWGQAAYTGSSVQIEWAHAD